MERKIDNLVVAKATVWYTVSNILLKGLSLFTAPIFTRLLSTADYGIASNFNTWTSILSCFTGLGLATAALRGKVEFGNKYKEYLSSIQTLGMLAAFSFAVILMSTLEFWADLMELDKICIAAMLVYLFAEPSVTYTQLAFRFDYHYKENVAISIINTVGSVICSVGLIMYWSEQRYLGRIFGSIIPVIIIGSIFAIRIYRQGKCAIRLDYWKYALNLSLPMIFHGLSMIILGQIDRVMIIKYCGESEAGVYSFGYSYAVLLSVVTNAVNDATQPQIYEMLERKDDRSLTDFVYKMIMGAAVLSALIIVAAPEALRVLGTKEYYSARWVIFPVVAGTLMQFIYQKFSVIEIYYKKTYIIAIGSALAAGINFFLNMVMIPRYGYIAAAYTTFASYGLLMLFHYIGARYVAKRKIYQFSLITGYTLFIIVWGSVCMYFYDKSAFVRYGITLLLIAGILIYIRTELKIFLRYLQHRIRKERG